MSTPGTTAMTAVAAVKKKNMNKRKRSRTTTRMNDHMGEGSEKMNEETEKAKRFNKKKKSSTEDKKQARTSRVVMEELTRGATSSSESLALRFDSDSLSLTFSFLTTREFSFALLVSRQWTNVSHFSTSWPKYSFEAVTNQFRLVPGQLQHPEAQATYQHRHVKVCTSTAMLASANGGVRKNTTALSIAAPYFLLELLSKQNFPHLTSLRYEGTPFESFGYNAATLIPQLCVLVYSVSQFRNVVCPIPFTQLRVLSITSNTLHEPSLVQLHQLEYFRLESSNLLRLQLTRILRYLSAKLALRSISFVTWRDAFGHSFAAMEQETQAIDALFVTPWKETINLIKQDAQSPYEDPIPPCEELPTALLHEFECMPKSGGVVGLHWRHIKHLCTAMPTLRRLKCTMRLGVQMSPNFVESEDFTQRLQHLDLLFEHGRMGEGANLDALRQCAGLRTLRLDLDTSFQSSHLPLLTGLTSLESLTLEFRNGLLGSDATWSFLRSMPSLQRFDLALTTDRPFPISTIAKNLASLKQFVRLDLRLMGKSFFWLPVEFFTAICSSPSWTQFHLLVSSDYESLIHSFDESSRFPCVSMEALASSALTRFRVYRHIKFKNLGKEFIETSTHRIRVDPAKGESARPKARWVQVDSP